ATLEVAPWLLCEARGGVLGYAYAGRFHARRAYQWTVEVTAYVHAHHHREGVGRGLYTSLLGCLALQGFRSAVGVIALPNPASVGLHERMGFVPGGVLRAVGYKHGRWHDVGWWQLALCAHDASPAPARAPRQGDRADGFLAGGRCPCRLRRSPRLAGSGHRGGDRRCRSRPSR